MRPSSHRPFCLLVFSAIAAYCGATVAQSPSRGDVTIYRCTDARGHLSLQDSPCAKGDAQSTRQMIRPVDPPPRPTPPASKIGPNPPPAGEARTIVLRTAQPMYECVRDDNTTYTSDTGDGNPRFVQDYGYGYPVFIGGTDPRPRDDRSRGPAGTVPSVGSRGRIPDASVKASPGNGTAQPRPGFTGRSDPSPPRPPTPSYPGASGVFYGGGYGNGGYWVRDACHALPQADICDRSRDRRDAIRTRFFNAQPSEREQLSKEERGLDARLAADCGGS